MQFHPLGIIKSRVYIPPLPYNLPELTHIIKEIIASTALVLLAKVWEELNFNLNVCRIIKMLIKSNRNISYRLLIKDTSKNCKICPIYSDPCISLNMQSYECFIGHYTEHFVVFKKFQNNKQTFQTSKQLIPGAYIMIQVIK